MRQSNSVVVYIGMPPISICCAYMVKIRVNLDDIEGSFSNNNQHIAFRFGVDENRTSPP